MDSINRLMWHRLALLAEIQERGSFPGPIVDAVAAIYARAGGENPYRAPMQAIAAPARASG